MVARSVRYWPGTNAYAEARSGGTSNATDTASGVSRLTSLTSSRWKRGAVAMTLPLALPIASVALEIIERFLACGTAPEPLARGRPELGEEMGVVGAAARAGDRLVPEQQPTPTASLGWSDAIRAQ